MDQCDYVHYLTEHLPELCRVRDLVRVGLYISAQAAYAARKAGQSPPFIHISQRGIIYEKQGVIDFIKDLKKKTGYPSSLAVPLRCLTSCTSQEK